ncbi:MAG: hypothetical protein ACYDBV_11540 [Nitrospiria bacterium]
MNSIDVSKGSSEFNHNIQMYFLNTQEGADLNSILFYICQMSENKNFSEETTTHLIQTAISAYRVSKEYKEETLKRKTSRETLGHFIDEGKNIEFNCIRDPNLELRQKEKNDWNIRVVNFLSNNLDYSNVSQFNNPPQGPSYSYDKIPQICNDFFNQMEKQILVLHSFINNLR